MIDGGKRHIVGAPLIEEFSSLSVRRAVRSVRRAVRSVRRAVRSVRRAVRAVRRAVRAGRPSGRPNTRAACATFPQCGQGLDPHICWQNIFNTNQYLRKCTCPNQVPEGHADTPQLNKTPQLLAEFIQYNWTTSHLNNNPQLLAEYIQYKYISQKMYMPQPGARRAHRHPPTE